MAKEEAVEEAEIVDPVKDTLKAVGELDLENLMCLGMTKGGGLVLQSSINNIPWMHWMLSKGSFDVNVYERNQIEARAKEDAEKETDAES
jgi:hypothetical protein